MIRRAFLVLAAMAAMVTFAHAQAPKGTLPPHQATLSWTNGSDPAGTTLTGSNVYRCNGLCTQSIGLFSVINLAPLSSSATSFTDTAVSANTQYSWCVTNLVTLSTGPFETACSNIVTATIPKDAAAPPILAAPVTQ